MPGLRSTRPRLPMLAVGAAAILILAACGDASRLRLLRPKRLWRRRRLQVEETAAPEEATAEASPTVTEEATPSRCGRHAGGRGGDAGRRWRRRRSRRATPVAEAATPVAAGSNSDRERRRPSPRRRR